MKSRLITMLVIWLSVSSVRAQILDTITFSFDDIVIDTVGDYVKVSMPNCSYADMIGFPELPKMEVKYIIPANKTISNVIVSDSIVHLFQMDYTIFPHQPNSSIGDTSAAFVQLDSSVYDRGVPFPQKTVEIVNHYDAFGYRIALLYVYPLVYYPQEKKIRFNSSVSFELSLSDNETVIKQPQKESKRMFELCQTLLKSQIRNINSFDWNNGRVTKIININESHLVSNLLLSNEFETIPEYIIITNNRDINGNELEPLESQGMSDLFQCFANWKTKKGIPTVVVTVDDINNSYIGNDLQAKIHNFLADVYDELGSMYVLLGGDINIVPERIINMDKKLLGGNIDHLSFVTDLYYSAIGSSWDYNLNGDYGETELHPHANNWINTDQSDNIADFFLARIPVSNCAEANSFINKTLNYEYLTDINLVERKYINNIVALMAFENIVDDPENNPLNSFMEFTNSIFGITEPVENGICQESLLKWRVFESKKIDSSIFNYWMPLCKNNAISCFNSIIPISVGEKAHIVLHCDHSSYHSMGTAAKNRGETINREEVGLLENSPFHKILISYGCSLGDFRKDCIVERFLNNPFGGGVAAIVSSTTSYNDEYERIQPFLMNLYQWKLDEVIYQPILYNISLLHANALGNGMLNKRKNHLFGDPELPIWTREPVDLIVSTSPLVLTNQDNELTVNVSGMVYSEYATNDVMVCVMKEGEVYKRESYNGTAHNHSFVFNIEPETAGELKVTVTGHNYIPYENTVPVNITGKNVYVSEKSVLDVTGNNNGMLDAGETVNLSISLKNNGTVNLNNVNAVLSCEFFDECLNQNINSYLTLVFSNSNYGTITKNATVTRNNYQLSLSKTIPDRTSLRCTLTVSDGSGIICTRSFSLPICAAEIEHVSTGNEIKPNGRIGLNIELANLGFGSAKDVEATLTSSDAQVTRATAVYGAMSHLESKTQSFEFIPNGSIDGTHFALTVTDAYNKSWSYNFILNSVSDTVENLTFTSTAQSITLRWSPVEDVRGYIVYRSLTPDGNYDRLNSYPIPSSAYSDLGLETKKTYYYGVSFLDEYGNESEMARITAWTSLPVAEGWPVVIPDGAGKIWGTAPNVADVDGDGKQEIFLTTGSGDQMGNEGVVYGFTCDGEELYDIDHNPTTISGFANLGISMTCTPAIGDIDNDGVMEIVVATRDGLSEGNHNLYAYKNLDADVDGIPDTDWNTPLDYRNFNGVVLADLDDDGRLEIVAPNQGRCGNTYVQVFDCFGHLRNSIVVPVTYNTDQKAVTMPVVADLDNNGQKEIVFGLEDGVYSWNCNNYRLDTLVCFYLNNPERTDCPVIAADIDGDADLEVLFMAIRNGKGYIRAVNPNGTYVNGWDGDLHYIDLSNTNMNWAWPPYFSVADIDNDGSIEIFAADEGALKMWNSDGTALGVGEIQIPNLDCSYFQPIIADVDGLGDCEIIIPSKNGNIYAFKTNGNTVPGWPLVVESLGTIPVITDIDGDGFNEVIAASQTEIYVWHTEGEAKFNQCDRFRYNSYNNAVYETPCSYNENSLGIYDTQVWNDDRTINKEVIIDSGARLTIKSNIRFAENSKIIVKQGGKLIVDGGTLTNSCVNEMWPGIQVWGDTCADQYLNHGGYSQGYLELKNGATIENAVCAIELWHPGVTGTTGGIVHADSAFFINNAKAVHALDYSYTDPFTHEEIGYNASFHNCSFTVNDDYPGTETFHKHVDLACVKGVAFEGCSFTVDPDATGVSPWCSAIAAYDAGFSATAYCDQHGASPGIFPCPDDCLVRCSFSGFYDAVHAVHDDAVARSFTVSDAVFSNNDVGVYAHNARYATVVRDSIAVGRGEDCAFGVYADGVSGLCLEENTFFPSPGYLGESYGIGLFNSESANDVYLNTLEGLTCGNLAVGMNTQKTQGLSTPGVQGLTYTCNRNTGNAIDFCVLGNDDGGGIRPQQGSAVLPAGNTFGASGYHFYNDGDDTVDYYYYSGDTDQIPDNAKLYRVNRISSTSENGCQSHSGLGNNNRSQEDVIRAILNDSVTDHQELRARLRGMGDLASDRLAIASYVQEGDFDGAFTLAQTLPSLYRMEGDELADHSNHLRLLGLYRTLRQSGRNTGQLTGDERLLVEDIARADYPYSGSLAKALLEGAGLRGSTGYTCPALPKIADKGKGSTNTEEREARDFKVTVTPNPASSQVTVEYILPEGSSRATLTVVNTLGENMTELGLEGNRGSRVVDLHELPASVYFFVVTDQSGRTSSSKLMIINH